MSKIIIIGGGAAGMLASIYAAKNGHKVVVYEKNEKLGKKLFITGKGRCNITNAADMETLFENVVTNRKFLYSAFYSYTNQDIVDLLEGLGVRTKVERGDRVFPLSDKSNDVIRAL
ncbi:MAG: NAD(P)/FAD-dependent oxidoreductase, partial [Clostridium sp.]|nr:NAD(P)/FAD-dependent oxidoreductase [Clostridium sp.]